MSIFLLIYTNGVNPTDFKWNKINNPPLFILCVGNKQISSLPNMIIEATNINESYPIDND